jgi:hypothetical protein
LKKKQERIQKNQSKIQETLAYVSFVKYQVHYMGVPRVQLAWGSRFGQD